MTKKMTRTALFAVAAVLVLAAICTAIALGTTSASAKTISGDSGQTSGTAGVTVTYSVQGGWKVSISDDNVTLEKGSAHTLTVTVEEAVLGDGKTLSVDVESQNNYYLKHGELDQLAYTVKKGAQTLDNSENKNIITGVDHDKVGSDEAKAELQIEISADSAEQAKYSGAYSDTLNFNVTVA